MRCCHPPSEAIYGAEASVARRNDALLSIVRGWPEIERLRLAVVATNSEVAEPFWRALGYQAVGAPVPYTYDKLETTAQRFERPLRYPTLAHRQFREFPVGGNPDVWLARK